MDPNIAAWMIAGGPKIELRSERQAREQLHAYLEGQRVTNVDRVPEPSLIERIARIVRPAPAPCADPACCPA